MSNEKIPTQPENPKGLHQRYYIQKIIPTREGFFGEGTSLEPVDKDAEYFVMRLDEKGKDPKHVNACRIGINAYADAIKEHLPELATDLKRRYPLSPPPAGSGKSDESGQTDYRIVLDVFGKEIWSLIGGIEKSSIVECMRLARLSALEVKETPNLQDIDLMYEKCDERVIQASQFYIRGFDHGAGCN